MSEAEIQDLPPTDDAQRAYFPGQGDALVLTIVWTLGAIFTAVALFNVFVATAISGWVYALSWFWLFATSLPIVWGLIAEGPRGFLHNRLSELATQHFATIIDADGERVLAIGYKLSLYEGIFERIRVEDVERITWSSGQATAQCGRDMDDWYVALRPAESTHEQPQAALCIPGPARPESHAAEFAHLMISLLEQEGLRFQASAESPRIWIRSESR